VRIDSPTRWRPTYVFYFSVERTDPRHALFVHGGDNSRDLLYFKAALEASGQSAFKKDPATPGADRPTFSARQVRVRVLSDVARCRWLSRTSCANTCARRLGAIALGHMSDGRARVPVTGDRIEETRYAGREGERFQTRPGWTAHTHPY